MNDYKALRTFLLAAEKRNFAQVARELDMTPAAVTRAIAAWRQSSAFSSSCAPRAKCPSPPTARSLLRRSNPR